MWSRMKNAVASGTGRVTALLCSLGFLLLYADSHLQSDIDLAKENSILFDEGRYAQKQLSECEQQKREYAEYASGPEVEGLKIIASAIHPRILFLQSAKDGMEPVYSEQVCDFLINRYKRLTDIVEEEKRFSDGQKEYLLAVIVSEALEMTNKCEEDLQIP